MGRFKFQESKGAIMPSSDMETLIRDITVDTEQREHFYSDPDAVLEEYELTETEREAIISNTEEVIDSIPLDEESGPETWLVSG